MAIQGVVPFTAGRPLKILAISFRENLGSPHTAAKGGRDTSHSGLHLALCQSYQLITFCKEHLLRFDLPASIVPSGDSTPVFLWDTLFFHA